MSLSEPTPLGQLALEEGTRQKLQEQVPPPTQLWQFMLQLRNEIAKLHQVVGNLAGLLDSQLRNHSLDAELSKEKGEPTTNNKNNNNNNNNSEGNNNNNTTNTNNNNTTNNNNNDNNDDNDNNKNSRESSLRSLDLDSENPESNLSGSEPDLDASSLGIESGLSSSDQQAWSLDNLGSPTLTVESSLRSLDQQDAVESSLASLDQYAEEESSDSFDQNGETIGTAWDPSLGMTRDNFGSKKPKKRVTFEEGTLTAYIKQKQNNRRQHSSQLEQLEHNKKKNKKNRRCKTTQACWTQRPQEHQKQKAWQEGPSTMQQQPATASRGEEDELRPTNNNNLDGEELSLGSLESETQATTNLLACESPKHNKNTSILGQDLKNKAAWRIMIDTNAAISLAPMSFAPTTELSPLESTLQLRSVTGKAIKAYGRRTVDLIGSQLSFRVSFVIADVEHALLGMDIFMQEQLSLQRGSTNEHWLVNNLGERTQLRQRGHHLFLEACPCASGLISYMRSSFQEENGSLLDDKDSAQDAASEEELTSSEVSASGGALGTSFHSEDLRQHKNTTTLGTTALPAKGARRNQKKKPSARTASHDHLFERSFEQKGQPTAATQLTTTSEKTSLMNEIELAAETGQQSLSNREKQELSLRILLTLSLRNAWQIATTRATAACSEDALGQQLRNIGLEKNKVDQNIFSGDELVILIHKSSILIGGTDLQQECLFHELSALIPLEQPTRLDQDTQVSFCNRTLECQESSHSISLSLPTSFYMELLRRHELEDAETIGSLEEEEPYQDASEQNLALDAGRQELYRHTVGELVWAATACRPDLSFEVHLLTQSLTEPTTKQERQLHRVLRYLAGTLHYTLSLHPTNQMAKEKAKNLELLAFSASSWTGACRTSTAYLSLWGVPLIASCKTSCAYNQEDAELESVKLALGLASHTRNFLQQLDVDQLGKDVNISLRTSSLHDELVNGRPLAKQLGLSRRNKHIQLRGQLQLSRVHPDKNLAHSLTNNASGKRVLAKLRVDTGAAETLALSTVRGHSFASLVPSSSLLVGMVNLEPPKMESLQLRQLALSQSETCLESLSKNLADKSLASLTLPSLSLQRSNSENLTLHSLSFPRGNLESLTLQSLSLIVQNRFPRISFKELLFGTRSLKELDENLVHQLAKRRTETNSFSHYSFEKDQLAAREAETNSFSTHSLQKWILSLRMCLRIIWLSNFQLVCAALSLGYLVSLSFQSLIEQLCNKSFQALSNQLCTSTLESLIIQLDLVTSLSLPGFGSTRCRHQLQSTSFDKSSFEHRAILRSFAFRESQPTASDLAISELSAYNGAA